MFFMYNPPPYSSSTKLETTPPPLLVTNLPRACPGALFLFGLRRHRGQRMLLQAHSKRVSTGLCTDLFTNTPKQRSEISDHCAQLKFQTSKYGRKKKVCPNNPYSRGSYKIPNKRLLGKQSRTTSEFLRQTNAHMINYPVIFRKTRTGIGMIILRYATAAIHRNAKYKPVVSDWL